jgi:hypothetical protein
MMEQNAAAEDQIDDSELLTEFEDHCQNYGGGLLSSGTVHKYRTYIGRILKTCGMNIMDLLKPAGRTKV